MADTQFELESDSPALPDMMFWQLAGVESFSRPSRYMLTVLSRNRQIKPDDVLGKSFTVKLEFHDEGGGAHKRQYQGHAMRMRRVGDANERLCLYHIELDSWFSLLQHRTNARIFQEKKLDEVIKEVMQDSNIRTVENIDYAGLREAHDPHRYCVQYLESDFDFLSRLMEHEGVYYWFDNAGTADGKKMMLADNVSVHEKLPVESQLAYAVESTSGESRSGSSGRAGSATGQSRSTSRSAWLPASLPRPSTTTALASTSARSWGTKASPLNCHRRWSS